MSKLVSIIVPFYNREEYLQKCIESILSQTYPNLEILLINDASIDNSELICNRYREMDSRIKILTNDKNMGVSYSRNRAIDVAIGDYFVFVDSDDFISKYYVEIMLAASEKYHCDIVQCKAQRECLESSEDIFNCNSNFFLTIHQDSTSSEWALQSGSDARIAGMVWAKLYNRAIWKDIRFPIGKIHEDEGVMHILLYNAGHVACISAQLYYQVNSNTSIMRDTFSKKRYDYYDMIEDRYNFFVEKGLKDCALVTAQRMAGSLIDLYRNTKNYLCEENGELIKKYKEILPLYINSPYLTNEMRDLHLKWAEDPEYGEWYFVIYYMREHFSTISDWESTINKADLNEVFLSNPL